MSWAKDAEKAAYTALWRTPPPEAVEGTVRSRGDYEQAAAAFPSRQQ